MTYAEEAAGYINAWCQLKFPDEKPHTTGARRASTMANGRMIDCFDHVGGGTHKYIPADRLTEDLGLPAGAGVFGYWKMQDGSYLLRTCAGLLAWWDGTDEGKAQWGEFAKKENTMIHVMSYALASDFYAQFHYPDRPGKDFDLADMAWPRFARLTSKPSEAWMASCRRQVEEALAEEYDYEDQPVPSEWRWRLLPTEVEAPDHVVETWGCYDPDWDASPQAIMVIRQVEDELP